MDRIQSAFARARREGRSCFVAYLCAGDPDYETSLELCRTLIRGGVDILELGVPFSDPLADGRTNQLAAQRALQSGITQQQVLQLARDVRAFCECPIVFYSYYNLIFSQGQRAYVDRLVDAGVDGLLALDLPPEEGEELIHASRKAGLKNIFIVAPTTPPYRVARIAQAASGFVYYVSREGVTGVRENLETNIAMAVSEIRRHTSLPVAVGFGISNRSQVREVAAVADGVVVGSALVNCIGEHSADPQAAVAALEAKFAHLRGGLQA